MGGLVVISDLHIASGPLDDCDAELQGHLQSFLCELSLRDTPLELVINGDFLDFVQAEPWSSPDFEATGEDDVPLCFTEEQSIQKLESIHAAHRPLFDGLTRFIHSHPDHLVTVMPGNHDADFYFEGVRKRFIDLVGPVQFFLDPVYRPDSCPSVWIEHGHQSDPVNCFVWHKKPRWSADSPPIFNDLAGTPRLFECIGTRFLLKFLNRLDLDYRFVDNVKPFSRFVKIFGASAFVPGYGSLKVAVTLGRLLAYLYATVSHHEGDVMNLRRETHRIMYEHLERQFRTLPRAAANTLTEQMKDRGFLPEMPLPMYFTTQAKAEPLLEFLSDHPELLDRLEVPGASLLGESIPGTLTLASGFSVDETKELKKSASAALATGGVELVLMGHTHDPVMRSEGAYINTGCWTRYYRFGSDTKTVSWDVLKTDSYLTFPYSLQYVEIDPDQPSRAELIPYKERHA